ncbi:MAG TPA: glycosyltransferase family 1 protein [Gemmatimonadales bacterium]
MRIGFNARYLASDDQRGFNRYTAELARALAALGHEVVLFSEGPIDPVHGLSEVAGISAVCRAVRPQARWQHLWLSGAIRRAKIEVFHAPAHWGIPLRCPCPTVATIHDVAGWELPGLFGDGTRAAAWRHRWEERLTTSRAARIITVSEYSARSIERYLGLDRARIAVTVEGAAPVFSRPQAQGRAAAIAGQFGVRAPWFLCVGGFETRKNLGLIVRALALLPPEERATVVLVGQRNEEAEALAEDARDLGVDRWLPQVDFLVEEDLAALYAGARAVIMPSLLEGFGLPVVEGMHAGTPAIVSSAGSLPEIAGDAAIVIDPGDAAGLAAAIRTLACDDRVQGALAARARARAPRFTWSAAADQTFKVYEEVLRKPA